MRWWRSSRDLSDEVREFYEDAVAHWIAQGVSPVEARRRAQVQFGNPTTVHERVRESGWEHAVETVMTDLVYACRRLRRDRAFAATAVLTLALGIGAATAIFTVVNAVLFAPLPYPDSDRIAMVWDKAMDGSPIDITFGTYRELQARTRSFASISVMRPWQPTLTGEAEPERVDGQRVSAAFFQVLGVEPLIGSAFAEADDRPDGPRVAILAHRLWQRRFSADPAIVGRQIVLDDASYTVVGVMPAWFENVLAPSAEIWSLLQYDPSLPTDGREWGHHLRLMARLTPGATADSAAADIAAVAREPVGGFARPVWASMAGGMIVRTAHDDLTRSVKPALLAVLGAVVLLLAIACVNVTNLLLARTSARRGELSMRSALGAGRFRLTCQLLTESLVLAICGGGAGIALASAAVRALIALSPAALPRLNAIAIDRTALLAAVGLTTVTGLVVGLLPTLHACRDLRSSLDRTSMRMTGRYQLTRRVLVIAEVALALVLLVAAGLLVRSVQHVFAVAPGFEPSNVLVLQIQTSGRRFADRAVTDAYFAQVLERVRAVAGVRAAGLTSQLPLSGDFEKYGIRTEFGTYDPNADQSVFRYAVSGDYFGAMGISLRRGRRLGAGDVAGAQPVVVISEALARQQFGHVDPLGKRIHVGDTGGAPYTVVGVAANVKQASLAGDQLAAAYIAEPQWHFSDRALWLVVKTHGPPAALATAVRTAIWSVDRNQPIVRVSALSDIVEASEANRRFVMVLFEVFGAVALALAVVGLYGLLSAGVSERTRDIGVRAALGASHSRIVREILREGLMLTVVGTTIGVAGAVAVSNVLVTLLFGVSPLDATTYAAVVAGLLALSALACAVPAWRAASIDPALALRAE